MDPPPLPLALALPVGEVARQAAMAQYGRLAGGAASPTLAGKDASGRPLARQHVHAHYLSLDDDSDGLIDHLLIWAPGGLSAREVAACVLIDALHDGPRSTVQPRFAPVRLRPSSAGGADAAGLRADFAGPARIWRSLTPFVPPRHTKWRGAGEDRRLVDSPEAQVVRELDHRALGGLIEAIEPAGTRCKWGAFLVRRRAKRASGTSEPMGFQLTFARPIAGPLALGFGAHFGLGLFVPDGDAGSAPGSVPLPRG